MKKRFLILWLGILGLLAGCGGFPGAEGESVPTGEPDRFQQMLSRAQAYNRRLAGEETGEEELLDAYLQILDLGGGLMGYLHFGEEQIPIYHGISKGLSRQAGHLPGSSLPIGGAGSHTVLQVCPRELEVGEVFEISILERKIPYQVAAVIREGPFVYDFQPGRELCTLMMRGEEGSTAVLAERYVPPEPDHALTALCAAALLLTLLAPVLLWRILTRSVQ